MILTMKEHLDALKEAELRTFQWHLTYEVKVGWPSIPWSQVENTTRETTVDIMVQAYGEDGAVEVMVTILKLMKRNDQASRLSQAKQSSKVGLHLLESLSSTVRETDRMISVDLSHSTFSFSGPVILDSSCLTNSDHQICQNCGTKVERPQITVPNLGAPTSIHANIPPVRSIWNRLPVKNTPATQTYVTPASLYLQSLPINTRSPAQYTSILKNWRSNTGQNWGNEGGRPLIAVPNLGAATSIHAEIPPVTSMWNRPTETTTPATQTYATPASLYMRNLPLR